MKNIFKIFAIAAVAFAALSCVKEQEHKPGEADLEGCYGVYFPVQEASGSHTYDPSMEKEIVISVTRSKTKDAIKVPYEIITDTPEEFTCGEIAFEDGQTETNLLIKFPKIKTGITYSLSLSISEPQYASKYTSGACNFDFKVMCVEWKKFFGKGATEATAGGVLTTRTLLNVSTVQSVETEMSYYETAYTNIRYCKLTRVFNFVKDQEPLDYIFYWNTATNNLYVPQQEFVTRTDGLKVAVGDVAAFYDSYYGWGSTADSGAEYFDWQPKWIAKNGFNQPYYDGNGGFYLADCIFLTNGGKATGSGWAFGDGPQLTTADLYIAPGFVRVDYGIAVESDYPEEGQMPLFFETGIDVAKIKYIAVEGKPTPNQLEELLASIEDNTAENIHEITEFEYDETTAKNYSSTAVSFETSGTYTVIAGAFDKDGEMQESTSIVLNYIAADDSSVDVKLTVGIEDTPKRYESAGHNVYNSLGYYVSVGEDATDVKVGLYTTATVDKFGMDAVLSDLRYEDEETNSSVSADILDEMKAVGGFYSLMTNLKDNTSYTLVVWATNGTKATFEAVEYTTAKYPEVWKSLGTGLYTEDMIGPMFEGLGVVSYEVEVEESEETPGKYRIINPYGSAYPYNEPGDWDTSCDYNLVIYANVPDRVWFGLQSTGLNWGVGDLSVLSMAYYYMANGKTPEEVESMGLFGTLNDGVITFPVKALGVANGGKVYYGNTNGQFKLILPSAYTPSEEARTMSVNRKGAVVKSGKEFGKAILSVGQKTYVSYEREIHPVEMATSNISSVRKEKNNKEISFKADKNILR